MSIRNIIFDWNILVSIYFLKSSFSLKLLGSTSLKISKTIKSSGLDKSRTDLKALVSRDPSQLNEQQVLAATIESVSENTSDSVIAPLLMFAIFGIPGALAYRSINTLDSMIGYRGEFELLGKASAKFPAVIAASCPVIASTTSKVSIGVRISCNSAISFIIFSSIDSLPAVSNIRTS